MQVLKLKTTTTTTTTKTTTTTTKKHPIPRTHKLSYPLLLERPTIIKRLNCSENRKTAGSPAEMTSSSPSPPFLIVFSEFIQLRFSQSTLQIAWRVSSISELCFWFAADKALKRSKNDLINYIKLRTIIYGNLDSFFRKLDVFLIPIKILKFATVYFRKHCFCRITQENSSSNNNKRANKQTKNSTKWNSAAVNFTGIFTSYTLRGLLSAIWMKKKSETELTASQLTSVSLVPFSFRKPPSI